MRSLAHLYPACRRRVAPAAAVERDNRAEAYPKLVHLKKVTADDAAADYRAWCAITLWTAGERIDFDIGFAEMELATVRALRTADQAVQRAATDQAAIARRDAIADIHALVSGHRDWLDDLNAALRRRAQREAVAA